MLNYKRIRTFFVPNVCLLSVSTPFSEDTKRKCIWQLNMRRIYTNIHSSEPFYHLISIFYDILGGLKTIVDCRSANIITTLHGCFYFFFAWFFFIPLTGVGNFHFPLWNKLMRYCVIYFCECSKRIKWTVSMCVFVCMAHILRSIMHIFKASLALERSHLTWIYRNEWRQTPSVIYVEYTKC